MSEPRFDLGGRSLRAHAARGTLINTAFMVGLSGLALVKGFVVAALLTREEYGLWGVLAVSIGTLFWLKQAGVGDRYVQQDEDDQELAFQRALGFETLTTGALIGALLAVLPLICVVYGEWDVLLPGLVIAGLVLPAGILRAPVWVFYRRMDFFRQRALQAVDPVVSLAATVALAVAGAGYWALVLGMLAGAWAAALAAVLACPYRLRPRFERASARLYWAFSWPLLLTAGSGLVIAQSATIATEATLGLAGVGAVALAAQITDLTNRVDAIVTGTLYPAICAVRDRAELLRESFVKSNRLALMWAVPFGLGLALFADDLVSYALGQRWRPAVVLLQVYGVVAAFGHVGFNWGAYFRARGETRPMAVAAVAAMVVFLAVGLPLLIADGLRGLAIGVAAQSAAHLLVRAYYLQRLFAGFSFLRHAMRAVVPALLAAGAVLLVRLAGAGERLAEAALAELALFLVLTAGATWLFERRLLREAVGYLSSRAASVPIRTA